MYNTQTNRFVLGAIRFICSNNKVLTFLSVTENKFDLVNVETEREFCEEPPFYFCKNG